MFFVILLMWFVVRNPPELPRANPLTAQHRHLPQKFLQLKHPQPVALPLWHPLRSYLILLYLLSKWIFIVRNPLANQLQFPLPSRRKLPPVYPLVLNNHMLTFQCMFLADEPNTCSLTSSSPYSTAAVVFILCSSHMYSFMLFITIGSFNAVALSWFILFLSNFPIQGFLGENIQISGEFACFVKNSDQISFLANGVAPKSFPIASFTGLPSLSSFQQVLLFQSLKVNNQGTCVSFRSILFNFFFLGIHAFPFDEIVFMYASKTTYSLAVGPSVAQVFILFWKISNSL